MNIKIEQAKRFKILNEMAIKGQKVAFGSSYMSSFPFYEIIQKKVTDYVVYNRSIDGLTVVEAIEICEDSLKNLEPENIIISFGENEEINDTFFKNYKILLLKMTKLHKNSKIALVNILEDAVVDKKLSTMAREQNIKYIKLEKQDYKTVFNILSSFFRNGKISFYDAMNC